MEQYISKSALVAEIEKLEESLKADCKPDLFGNVEECMTAAELQALDVVKETINTLEVKEVEEEPISNDLEEAADKHLVEKGYLLTTNNGEHLAEVEAKGLFKAGAKWQKEQMLKGVDLKKELSYEDYIRFFEEHPNFPDDWGFDECWVFAEYFYKLGLKAQKGE